MTLRAISELGFSLSRQDALAVVRLTRRLHDGNEVSGCCAEGPEGHVYPGKISFAVERVDASKVPQTRTKVMLIVGNPSPAFALSAIPNAGVGLARTEFIIANHIGIHPMALARYPHLKEAKVVRQIRGANWHGRGSRVLRAPLQ